MIPTLLWRTTLGAVLLLAMWAGSLWVYDHAKMNDALGWRWAELHGEALYTWPFNLPTEIVHGNGLEDFTWSEGTLSGDDPDPYFYLNLEGRYIDAGRFTEIRLRLRSENSNSLRLFHAQGHANVLYASELIPVDAGWQTMVLSLPALSWYERDLADPDSPARASSWGGPDGVVTALRVDPVENGEFEVDWIELDDLGRRPELVDEIETFKRLDDDLFERMRAEPGRTWHIAQDTPLRTPETSHWTRQRIAEMFPSAILFPRPPQAEELGLPPYQDGLTSVFVPACIFIAALLFLVVRNQIPPPWRSLVAVVALVALVEAYVYWVPGVSNTWRVLVTVPLLGAIWELAPRTAPRYLVGDWRAWLLVSPLLVISLLLLVFTPYDGPEAFSVPEALGKYFFWALFQQFVVAVLILPRLKPILGRLAIIASAAVFGFFHFPNFALMAATFLLGIALLHIYERHRNLLAIAATQAGLAVSFNALALQFFWLSRTIGPTFSLSL